MVKILKQFDHWREDAAPGFRKRPVWPKAVTAGVAGVLLAAFVVGIVLYRAGPPEVQVVAIEGVRPKVTLTVLNEQTREGAFEAPKRVRLSAAETLLDPARWRDMRVYFLEHTRPTEPIHSLRLYSSSRAAPPVGKGLNARLRSLAEVGYDIAKGFPKGGLAFAEFCRYQLVLEATSPESRAAAKKLTLFAGPDLHWEPRDEPWPIWIQSPYYGQVLESPFLITAQAYKDGYVQFRVKPKRWPKYYLAPKDEFEIPVTKGEIVEKKVYEGSWEGFELYALFAEERERLPHRREIDTLPGKRSLVDVIGPIDFYVNPLVGPIRTDAQIRSELDLVQKLSARFTVPDQKAEEIPQAVRREYRCSGEVFAGIRYVLGVRPMYPVEISQGGFKSLATPTHYVWMQSESWKMPNGRFEDRLVKLGTGEENKPWLFEIWLIAIEPDATVHFEEYQAWLASALPQGCVRAASVRVIKQVGSRGPMKKRPNPSVKSAVRNPDGMTMAQGYALSD